MKMKMKMLILSFKSRVDNDDVLGDDVAMTPNVSETAYLYVYLNFILCYLS